MIPYGHQEIVQTDVDSVIEVLRSEFLTQGPAVPRFERGIAAKVGAGHAVAVNSATAALHIACLALRLGPGDRLWTVPNTFVASANCGHYCGAEVDFVDIDPITWNLSIPRLKEKLANAKKSDRLPKVVVPVHFGGQPTEQEFIWELGQEYGFKILEDAAHAIGARRNGEPVGSCRWSDVTVFSFHPVKIITTGEGGIALTNDHDIAERMKMLRSHGITRDRARFLGQCRTADEASAFGDWYYEQQVLGFNYRMTDIQAALGASQLARLDSYVERRNIIARRYDRAFEDLSLQLPSVLRGNLSAFHLYVIRRKRASADKNRGQIFDTLRRRGIGVNVHYMPVHLQPFYRQRGFSAGMFPEAEAHGDEAISLPLYPTLSDQQQDQVVRELRELLCND